MDSRSSTVINGILDRLQRDRSFADYSQLIQANNAHSSSFIKRALHNAWYGEGSGLSNSPKEVTGLGPVPLSEPPHLKVQILLQLKLILKILVVYLKSLQTLQQNPMKDQYQVLSLIRLLNLSKIVWRVTVLALYYLHVLNKIQWMSFRIPRICRAI